MNLQNLKTSLILTTFSLKSCFFYKFCSVVAAASELNPAKSSDPLDYNSQELFIVIAHNAIRLFCITKLLRII